jgi:hypothetical protein
VHPAVADAVASWVPLSADPSRFDPPDSDPSRFDPSASDPSRFDAPGPPRLPAGGAARIRVVPADGRPPRLPAGEPMLEVVRVRAWMDGAGSRVRVAGPRGAVRGTVDLTRRRATLAVDGAAPFSQALTHDVSCALTLAAALLLGRAECALLHAGAVVAPDGRAWLLVGDSHSGKTTTCANLIRAGWDWLADDQVVVARGPGGEVRAEGWPRPFTLDDGFEAGAPLGRRSPADPARLGRGRWRRTAPLGGVLLPQVDADRPTRLEPAHPAAALAALIRQSPWLLADRHAAPRVLALLEGMAKTSVFCLRLGRDGYAAPELLRACVSAAMTPPTAPRATLREGGQDSPIP